MMDDEEPETLVAQIAAAIGEKARSKMLFCLLDGRARTSTELSVVAEVGASTASAHLGRLCAARLVEVSAQGRHRYFSLAGKDIADILEGLSRLACDNSRSVPAPRVSARLRSARTCYDHLAGVAGVAVHDRLFELGWLSSGWGAAAYEVTAAGSAGFAGLGVDLAGAAAARRKFACACLDWSERRAHLAGALGAALLDMALGRKWLLQDLDSRALEVTGRGRRELLSRLGLQLEN